MIKIYGTKVVFGIPDKIMPIEGDWEGAKMKFRFRVNRVAQVFIRKNAETIKCTLVNKGDVWGLILHGKNSTK